MRLGTTGAVSHGLYPCEHRGRTGGKCSVAWIADVMGQWIRRAEGIRDGLGYNVSGRIGDRDKTF